MDASTISQQVLADVVGLACRAPSVHNTQPWRLVARDGELRLFLEPHRVPRATDRSGRQSVISCGALLDHLRVAAAAAGWKAHIARFPNPNDLDHLATLDFRRMEFVGEADQARADAILRRRTDRLPFAAPASWAFVEPVVRATVDPDKAILSVLPETVRPQLAEASRLTESLRRYDDYYHAELHWWTGAFEVSDGVPHSALPSTSERDRVDVGRAFPTVEHPDRRTETDHSAIAVLSTDGDGRREALGCGEVLSDVLLEATLAGLATCTLTHITELEASRAIIRALIGDVGDPQLLIRIGQIAASDDPPPPTPRRPLGDVLTFR
ncbi:MAG: NAD(P)H nitroreductase [Mycobacterium sp.]|nr:NAD(P)H nitroreductase [Mycobacterium sp.]